MPPTRPVTRPVTRWLTSYAVAAAVLVVLDLLWLLLVARDLYADLLGPLQRAHPVAVAAAAFYVLYVAAIVFFVVLPALEAGSPRRALLAGAFLGLVSYATWDLTNLAVIKGFPGDLVAVDLTWGTVLTATTSLLTYAVVRRVGARSEVQRA